MPPKSPQRDPGVGRSTHVRVLNEWTVEHENLETHEWNPHGIGLILLYHTVVLLNGRAPSVLTHEFARIRISIGLCRMGGEGRRGARVRRR